MRLQALACLTLPLLLLAGAAQATEPGPRRQLQGQKTVRHELRQQLEGLEASLPRATAALLHWQLARAESDLEVSQLGEQLAVLSELQAESAALEGSEQAKLESSLVRLERTYSGRMNIRQTEALGSKRPRKFTLSRGAFLPSPNGF